MDMKTVKPGLICPKCQLGRLIVYCVRGQLPRIRYRKCNCCGHLEKTVEA